MNERFREKISRNKEERSEVDEVIFSAYRMFYKIRGK